MFYVLYLSAATGNIAVPVLLQYPRTQCTRVRIAQYCNTRVIILSTHFTHFQYFNTHTRITRVWPYAIAIHVHMYRYVLQYT